MTDRSIALTRRKILASLGAVGVAGAGAGLGTSALFSDEESFTNNSITAGTLDMSVTATVVGANEYWEERAEGGQDDDLAIDDLSKTADGDAVAGLSVTDVKPGDWAIICFEFDVEGNPAYVQIGAENLVSSENGIEEPEPDIGESGGELEDEMLALLYRNFKGVQPGNSANPPYSYLRNGSLITPGDSTVRETYGLLSAGYTLSDGNGQFIGVGSGDDAVRRYLLLHLPKDVGNVVQGDGFSLDLVFRAVQVRNNRIGSIDIQEQTATPDPTDSDDFPVPDAYIVNLPRVRFKKDTGTIALPVENSDGEPGVSADDTFWYEKTNNAPAFVVGLHSPNVGNGQPDSLSSLIGVRPLRPGGYNNVKVPIWAGPPPWQEKLWKKKGLSGTFPSAGDTLNVTATLWYGPDVFPPIVPRGSSKALAQTPVDETNGPVSDAGGLISDSATVTFE